MKISRRAAPWVAAAGALGVVASVVVVVAPAKGRPLTADHLDDVVVAALRHHDPHRLARDHDVVGDDIDRAGELLVALGARLGADPHHLEGQRVRLVAGERTVTGRRGDRLDELGRVASRHEVHVAG